MKTIKFLSMAALVLVGAMMTGCSSNDNIIDTPQQPENKGNVVTLTTTVGLDEGAEARGTTRALGIDYENKQAVKTFAAGETMAIVYTNTSGTAKAVSAALTAGNITNDGKSATFTFTLENPDKTKPVTYIYPAAMAKDNGDINYDALSTQNGTLTTLSSSLDLATYSDDWDGTSLPAGTLVNQLAVCALTLKNSDGSSPITSGLTQVTVNDGSNTYTVAPTSGTFGEDVIYVAIRPVEAALQYNATDGTNNYTKTATSREYAAGNFYNLGLRMVPAITYTAPTLRTGLKFNGNQSNVSGSPQNLVIAGSVTHGTIYYSTDGGSSWSTSLPTQTDAGTYTVHYKVEPDAGYSGGVGSTSLGSATMAKADGWCVLDSDNSRGWNNENEKKEVIITVTHHGSTLTYSTAGHMDFINIYPTSDSSTFKLYKASNYTGYGSIKFTSATTTNYNAASAIYYCYPS